jgi:hypothetical protein
MSAAHQASEAAPQTLCVWHFGLIAIIVAATLATNPTEPISNEINGTWQEWRSLAEMQGIE